MSTNKIILKSSDEQLFEISEVVIEQSTLIKNLVTELLVKSSENTTIEIPIPNVKGDILSKIIVFCEKNVDDDKNCFVKEQDEDTLFDLMNGAEYLGIPNLLDVTTSSVSKLMEDKSTDDLRKMFNITTDYTPEEEAQVREENRWAFD